MPESSAMDSNVMVAQLPGSLDLSACSFTNVGERYIAVPKSLPSLDAGFRHPWPE